MTAIGEIAVKRIDGSETTLGAYAGEVLLVVNVASKCGLTPQYSALEALFREYREQGFAVLGFPCNQFRGQEPGSDEEIAGFCSSTYDVDFPLFSKIEVNGPGRHPLYAALVRAVPEAQQNPTGEFRARLASFGHAPPPGDVFWNFEKFLIARDGSVVARFAPDVPPDHPLVTDAVRTQLAQ
nr:glutathione peroxidase [uncultured Lichenicoccus sp.]